MKQLMFLLAILVPFAASAKNPDFSSVKTVYSVWDSSTTTYQSGSDVVIPAQIDASCSNGDCYGTFTPEVDSPTYTTINGGFVAAKIDNRVWTLTLLCEDSCAPIRKNAKYSAKFGGRAVFDCSTGRSQSGEPLADCGRVESPAFVELTSYRIDKRGKKKTEKSRYKITYFSDANSLTKAGETVSLYSVEF